MKYGPRNIAPGYEYDKYFDAPDNENTNVGNNPVVYNVDKVLPEVVKKYNYQTEKIANVLYDKNRRTFSKNIWEFLFNHIQYEHDQTGKEQFRSPARSWADRTSGIDCDCFSIFASCILTNKNIPHYIRITKYDNNTMWQHIYVIVPKPDKVFNPYNKETYYTIDAVIHGFDVEKSFTDQKTYIMNGQLGIVTEVLHGIDGIESPGDIFADILNGIDGISSNDLRKIKKHIVDTKEWIKKNPELYRMQGGDPQAAIKMYDYAIDNFDKGEDIRNKAFEVLAVNEARYNKEVLNLDDADLDGVIDDDNYQFSGIGELGKTKVERKAARQEKKAAKAEKKAEKKKVKDEKKQIKQQSKVERKDERKENKQERKDERKEAQGFFRKVGVAVKQGGEAAFVKYNPAIIAARQGFLAAVKLNLFRLSSRLKPAYGTEADAKRLGVNYKSSKKMLDAVERIFSDKLQGMKSELKEAVLIGALREGQDFKGIMLHGLGLGDPVTMASILTAVPVFVSILSAISQVENEEGVEGLGYIDDDVFETEMFLDDVDAFYKMSVNGLGAIDPAKINVAAITQFIKNFFSKIKENRDEKKGMTKEERKEYNKIKKEYNKSEKERMSKSGNASNMDKLRTGAGTWLQKMTNKNEEPTEEKQPEKELPIDNTKTTNESWLQRNKKKVIIGSIFGLLGLGGVWLWSKSKSKSKNKSGLSGLNKTKVIKAKL